MRNYLLVLIVLLVNPAYAHNVVGGVYAIGSLIEGEVGFSNGDMAPAGTPVIISDASGKVLAEMEVEDEGEGIPDDVLPKIFDPLFTTKQIGTGLGLSSCQSIIHQHNGTIHAYNNPTRFVIKLPKDPLINEEILE